MNALTKWRSGLMDEMTREVQHSIRYKRIQRAGWINPPCKKEYVVRPTFHTMMRDDRETGRSMKAHTEIVDEMITRHELGACLWSSDLKPADTEEFDVELTAKESEFISKILAIRDSHLVKSN